MKKKLLMYTNYFYPEVATTGQILTELAEGLTETFDVTVICEIPSYAQEIEEKYKVKKYYFEEYKGMKVIRVRVPEVNKQSKVSRVKYILSYFFNCIGATFKAGKFDLVFTVTQPPILGGLLGVIGKIITRGKLMYQIMDFNPEQTIAVNYAGNKLVLGAMMWFDKLSCRFSDVVVTLGRDMQETLYGYYNITKQFLEKYGIPVQILTDNRTVFNYQKHGKSSEERNTFTQYGFMCHRLGISLTTSSIPQVKGRIERLFQTLQSRLVVELSLNNINNIVDANGYLPQFIDMFNNEFSLPYNDTINAFECLQESQNINEFLTIVAHRKVDNGCTIKYNNSYYKIYNQNGKPLSIKPKSECLVVKTFDDKYFVLFDSTQYFMEKLETHRKDSILEPKIEKEKKSFSPAWNHPWRKAFYENYLKYYRPNQQNNYAYNYE